MAALHMNGQTHRQGSSGPSLPFTFRWKFNSLFARGAPSLLSTSVALAVLHMVSSSSPLRILPNPLFTCKLWKEDLDFVKY